MKVEFYLKLGGNLPQMTFYLHEHYFKTESSISFNLVWNKPDNLDKPYNKILDHKLS